MSYIELESKYFAEIKLLKSLIKSLKKEVTLAQKASSSKDMNIHSLEAKITELEGKLINSIPQSSFFDFNNIEVTTEIINKQEKLPNWVNNNLKRLVYKFGLENKVKEIEENCDY